MVPLTRRMRDLASGGLRAVALDLAAYNTTALMFYERAGPAPLPPTLARVRVSGIGVWLYLSNAACLMRPHFFHVFSVVSRIIIICYMICHCNMC